MGVAVATSPSPLAARMPDSRCPHALSIPCLQTVGTSVTAADADGSLAAQLAALGLTLTGPVRCVGARVEWRWW